MGGGGGGSCGEMEAGACLPAGSPHWNICLWGCSRCGGEDEATLQVQLSCQVVAGRIPRSQLSFQIFVKCFAFLFFIAHTFSANKTAPPKKQRYV